MKNQLLLLFCLVVGTTFAQSTNADEKAIRQMVDRENAGERLNTTDNAVFWSGAYDRPQVGKLSEADRKKMLAEFTKRRANNHQSRKIERLVIASSGDVAYEYGTFNISFDTVPDNKHIDHDGGICGHGARKTVNG